MQNSQVFQVQGGDLFDSTMHTQGGLNHLMQHLWDAYKIHLQDQIETRQKEGKPTVDLTTAVKKAPASNFAEWATEYLKEFRVTESFFIDGNLGVRLANNVCVAVSPGVEIRGTMQEAAAIQVTEGRSQLGNNGVTGDGGSLRI